MSYGARWLWDPCHQEGLVEAFPLRSPLKCMYLGAMDVVVGLFLIETLICHHLGCVTKGEQRLQAAQGGQIVVSFMGALAAVGPPLNLECKLTLWEGGPVQAEDAYTKQTNRVPTNCSSAHTILAWLLCKK